MEIKAYIQKISSNKFDFSYIIHRTKLTAKSTFPRRLTEIKRMQVLSKASLVDAIQFLTM